MSLAFLYCGLGAVEIVETALRDAQADHRVVVLRRELDALLNNSFAVSYLRKSERQGPR